MEGAARFLCSCLIFGAFFIVTGLVFLKINEVQPNPYMDELFHIPQAQKYCDGNWTQWDPMITTLPGLYLVSAFLLKPLEFICSSSIVSCSTFFLRSINVLFTSGNAALLFLLSLELNNGDKMYTWQLALMNAVILSLFPVLYFFTFLYYTDCGSVFFVLLMYLLQQQHRHLSAALSGTIAILFRQTNIIWIVFMAGLLAADIIRKFSGVRHPSWDNVHVIKVAIKKFHHCVQHNRKELYDHASELLRILPYGFVCIGFAVFVVINGSIVVGAKQDHQAGLHFPQLFYFAAFLGIFSFMYILSVENIRSYLNLIYQHPFIFVAIFSASGVIIGNFTMAHRYLLSDNRHYTFYIWARIFQRYAVAKYVLIPGYIFCMWAAFKRLEKDILWAAVYCICVAANLVPATLIEFRYFILPYLFYRLNINKVKFTTLSIEFLLYAVVNSVTICLFLNRPFYWNNDLDPQRFMW